MQTLVQVVCAKGPSLRDRIVNDDHGLEEFRLVVQKSHRPRLHGAGPRCEQIADRRVVLDIEWDADTRILICRIVNKMQAQPNRILGDFVDYLFERSRTESRR